MSRESGARRGADSRGEYNDRDSTRATATFGMASLPVATGRSRRDHTGVAAAADLAGAPGSIS
jgi:hypothetical protein